jgi:hypothetical protein
MAGIGLTDGKDEPRIERPQCNPKPSATLLAHSEQAALPSQQKAINTFCAAEAAKCAAETALALNALCASPDTAPSSSRATSPDYVSLNTLNTVYFTHLWASDSSEHFPVPQYPNLHHQKHP